MINPVLATLFPDVSYSRTKDERAYTPLHPPGIGNYWGPLSEEAILTAPFILQRRSTGHKSDHRPLGTPPQPNDLPDSSPHRDIPFI